VPKGRLGNWSSLGISRAMHGVEHALLAFTGCLQGPQMEVGSHVATKKKKEERKL